MHVIRFDSHPVLALRFQQVLQALHLPSMIAVIEVSPCAEPYVLPGSKGRSNVPYGILLVVHAADIV